MARIQWSDVTAIPGTEVCGRVTEPRAQAMFLEAANNRYDASMFDGEDSETYRLVRCLFVAHLVTNAALGASAGPVTEEEAFRVRTKYATDPNRLEQTQFSRQITDLASVLTRAPILLRPGRYQR